MSTHLRGPYLFVLSITIIILSFSSIEPFVIGSSDGGSEDGGSGSQDAPTWNDETMDYTFSTDDDLLFIHHSVGYYWLNGGLDTALVNKNYIDERNDIYYGSSVSNDSGRQKSLGSVPGDNTDMRHWIMWFNDYLGALKKYGSSDGRNSIIMFKSCYPNSNIGSDGTEPGNPFSTTQSIANYKAIFRHYNGYNNTYSDSGYTYYPLERIFANNPDILFIFVTSPPRNYGPSDQTTDAEAQRARDFDNWLKNDWLASYNTRDPTLDNVAVYDFFDFLSYPANHASHPNRLKKEFGGESGDSHPNSLANTNATNDFAKKTNNFIDVAYQAFNSTADDEIDWSMFRHDKGHSGRSSYALNLQKGAVKWSFATNSTVESSPSISSKGDLFVGSNNGYLYSLSSSGVQTWRYSTGDEVRSSPTLMADGRIVFGSDNGYLYCLKTDGSLSWRFKTKGAILSSPVIGMDGRILIGSDDDRIYSIWPNGSASWNFSTGGDIRSSPAVSSDGTIYFGSNDTVLYALNPNGTQKWKYTAGGSILSSPSIMTDGTIYFGSNDDKVYALNANGTKKWSYTTNGDVRSSPAINKTGYIIVGSDDKSVYCLRPNGSKYWSYSTGGMVRSSPAIDGVSKIVVGSLDKKIYFLRYDGTKLWDITLGGEVVSSPSIDKSGVIYIGCSDGKIYALGSTVPSAPRNLSFVKGSSSVNLSWTAPINEGGSDLKSYAIYRKVLGGSFSILGKTGPSVRFYVDKTASRGSSYEYYVTANNTLGESAKSNSVTLDWKSPVITEDSTKTGATTGDPIDIKIKATDDIGLKDIYVDYRFGGGASTNITMSLSGGQYLRTIPVPSSSTSTLSYRFHISDVNGNWLDSAIKNVPVVDDDTPTMIKDSSYSTAMYGRPYIFNVTLEDNIGIKSVFVEHWIGTGNHTNSSMTLSSPNYLLTKTIPNGSSGSLFYIVRSNDTANNWFESTTREVSLWDADEPVIGSDSSGSSGTTGDPFLFNVSVYDNIGVKNVTVEYWFGSSGHTNVSMNASVSDRYLKWITIPWNSTQTLHYLFHASDTSGNWVNSAMVDVTIHDNDRPTFGTDSTPTSGTTGESFTFGISSSDNIGVSSVYLDYWYGSGTHTNVSMSGSGPYSYQVTIPAGSTNSLHYIFHAVDGKGNWGQTVEKTVTIMDNDRPIMGTDSTPTSGTTGDPITFSISVTDNIGVASAYVEYWYGSGAHMNVTMAGSGIYTYQITIPTSSTSVLHYLFHAVDGKGNWAQTTEKTITVIDNDRPTFGSDLTPSSGTTGDSFIFNISVTDNMGVSSVHLEYWFGSGTHTNVSMSGTGSYSYQITIPSGSTSSLHYIFHSSDARGNWAHTSERSVIIIDNDLPTFGTDSTPGSGTTGEAFTFSIIVNDNIGIASVHVEYWYGSGTHSNISMSGTGPYTYQITLPSGSTDTLHYLFHASDSKGNWVHTSERTASIVDNDAPAFGTDSTPGSGTTGESLMFSIYVSDNIGLSSVRVDYWYGSGSHTNVSMSGSGTYTYQITIPSDSTNSLHYIFRSVDAKGNWAHTSERTVNIVDNDRPTFGTDSTPSTGSTGDSFIFNIVGNDNIGITSVYVEYWFGSGTHTNTSMNGDGPFTYQITIPAGSTNSLHYIFHAVDGKGNWAKTSEKTVTIVDDDRPVFGSDATVSSGTTGDSFTFSIAVSDNVGISSVYVEYWYGSGTHTNVSMIGSGTFTYQVTIPSGSTSSMYYLFHASDTKGNWAHTTQRTVTITDNDKPVFGTDTTPSSGTTGDPFTFTIDVSDNTGVSSVFVEYWYGSGTSTNTSMTGSEPYSYQITIASGSTISLHYIFRSVDQTGNWARSFEKILTIADNDRPIMGTDTTPSSGNTGDPFTFSIAVSDNVGISSVQVEYWYGSGTHTNVSMSGSGTYAYQITIPSTSTSSLHYLIHAADSSGNWAYTSEKTVPVLDNDIPTFGTDSTPSSGSTGGSLAFNIYVSDNLGVSSVYIEYWYGSGTHTNTSMGGSNPYSLSITLPINSVDPLHYIFHASDTSGNWAKTNQKDITVRESIRPTFGSDSTPSSGTTGDPITFSISATDNMAVSSVWVEYWFGSGTHTNVTMSGTGSYTYQISLPSSSTSSLHYIFHASDTSGNWAHTSEKIVPVLDNDRPTFGSDSTPNTGTTGDAFNFVISVSDNIGVSSVRVEYWYGSGTHSNLSMIGSGPYSYQVTLPAGSTSSLHYIFHVSDTTGNWAYTAEKIVNIVDNDRPTFGSDTTPTSGTTGESVTFRVSVTDNLGVTSVRVEYWFGSGTHTNVSMVGTGSYSYQISLPSGSTSSLHYIFHSSDSSGNWAHTTEKIVVLTDNDRPTFGTDSTPTSGTTGDGLTFSVSVSDNIGVSAVCVEYWFGAGGHTNQTMSGSGTYSFTLTVPGNSLDSLHYIFRSDDTTGNWAQTSERTVSIRDNDRPSFGTDQTPVFGTTGDTLMFTLSVSDNIGVSSVFVEYWYGSGAHTNVSMTGTGPYTYQVIVPGGSVDALHYIVHASDPSGNWGLKGERIVTVLDNDGPIIGPDSSPPTATTGDQFVFDVEVSDNIGTAWVSVEYWFGSGSHQNTTMTGSYSLTIAIPGGSLLPLHYYIIASDLSGNIETSEQKEITVLDNDAPTFQDDLSASSGTTGDVIVILCSISDNIGVDTVVLEYWYADSVHMNVTMSLVDGNYSFEMVLPSDSLLTLHYLFRSSDEAGNWMISEIEKVLVSDNDKPEIVAVISDPSCTTGDPFFINVTSRDNIMVEKITIEYWYGTGSHQVSDMIEGLKSHHITIMVPSDMVDDLHYRIYVVDISNNSILGEIYSIDILDNDVPALILDNTPSESINGGRLIFMIEATDNIGIDSIHIEYWIGNGPLVSDKMSIANLSYFFEVAVPLSLSSNIVYRFFIADGSENIFITENKTVRVLDRTEPEIIDRSPSVCNTGDMITLQFTVTDNIALKKVTLTYWFGSSAPKVIKLFSSDGRYRYEVNVPMDSLEPLKYKLNVEDTSGNINVLGSKKIDVIDDVAPSISPISDITIYLGERIFIKADVLDNIGIISIGWKGGPVEGIWTIMNGTPQVPGVYNIILTVFDGAGNSETIYFKVTVIGEEQDTDGDGMPDIWEVQNDLNATDPSDGSIDDDSDGLTNIQEYLKGTDPQDDDTDNDSLPDGWEDSYGLDPLVASALNDTDGDGKNDFQEYLDGTDPNKKEQKEKISYPLALMISFIVGLIVVIAVSLVILNSKKMLFK